MKKHCNDCDHIKGDLKKFDLRCELGYWANDPEMIAPHPTRGIVLSRPVKCVDGWKKVEISQCQNSI